MRMLISCTLVMIFGLAGCAMGPASDPNRFSMEPADVAHMRATTSLSLRNAYGSPSPVHVAMGVTTFTFDQKQLTDTAITMLTRAVEKHGIKVVGGAEKTMTLRVRPQSLRMQGMPPRRTSRLVFDAQYGDGTSTSLVSEETTMGDFERSMDGAVLAALKALVQDEKFLAYMNR
jgi:hypothetical protein